MNMDGKHRITFFATPCGETGQMQKVKNLRVHLIALVFAVIPLFLRAGGDEVVVIYNPRLPESKEVAEYYAKMRQVPARQIYGFTMTTNEQMSRDEFRDSLQEPLAAKLAADKLWRFGDVTVPATNGQPKHVERRVVGSKIRYAVLCHGVPLKIAADPSLHEPTNGNVRLELLRNEAAVDSELTWLPAIKMNVPLAGPLPNWVYGVTNAALLNPTNGVLLVARLDGPTPEIARSLVDKALAAERDGLWGRAYFDVRDTTDPGYKLGDEWIRATAEISRGLGFETVVDESPGTFPADFPMSQIAIYAGWYAENVNGPFALPKVEFMPGAFAYHLHSSSAASLRSTNQYWVGPFLAKGVTCTMGCVYEPYLVGTPNVAVFLGRCVNGFTFGEAALAAQPVLSWQTTVVGDPLYRLFGKSPSELHAALARAHNPLIEWSHLRIVDLGIAGGTPIAQLVNYLERIDPTAHSAVLTEKLADLYAELGKPSAAIDTCERALKLNPSPEQGIRLRLTLANKLLAANRETDAVENYRQLLKEAPDYPGNPSISAKLTALEQKLANTNAPVKP
jgi:uncharacterized protein (TIGR03790 family)